jgi:hypothetical protein
MTAILAIRVNDGVVLAAEGRTLITRNSDGQPLAGFDQAGKVFPICAAPPVAFAACGAGSVGGLSMRFLAGELEDSFRTVQPAGFQEVLERAANLIHHRSEDALCPEHNRRPDFDWLIGGYEGQAPLPCLWRLSVRHGRPRAPERLERLLVWSGEGANAIARLIGGVAPEIPDILRNEIPDRPTVERLVQLLERVELDLVHPEMPLGTAVDLARLLLDTAIGIERLRGAMPSAGGSICIGVVDRHRGFRYLSGEPL